MALLENNGQNSSKKAIFAHYLVNFLYNNSKHFSNFAVLYTKKLIN